MSLQEAGQAVGNWAVSALALLGPLAANVGIWLYAQAEPSMLMQVVKEFGVLAALVWYMYYTMKFEKPATQKHYEQVLEKIETNDKEKNKEICKSLDGVADSLKRLACSHHTPRQDGGE